MPQHVTIMRRWTHPEIKITLDDHEINLKIPLNDFLEAVRREIGGVTWTFTEKTFKEKLDRAVATVIGAVKHETKKIIT